MQHLFNVQTVFLCKRSKQVKAGLTKVKSGRFSDGGHKLNRILSQPLKRRLTAMTTPSPTEDTLQFPSEHVYVHDLVWGDEQSPCRTAGAPHGLRKVTGEAKQPFVLRGKIKLTARSLELRHRNYEVTWRRPALCRCEARGLQSVMRTPSRRESGKDGQQLLRKPDFGFSSSFLPSPHLWLFPSIETYRHRSTWPFCIQKDQKMDTNSKRHRDPAAAL